MLRAVASKPSENASSISSRSGAERQAHAFGRSLAIEAETNGERAKAAALYRKAVDMCEPTLGANIPADVKCEGADVAK